jgi:hypothetical protein
MTGGGGFVVEDSGLAVWGFRLAGLDGFLLVFFSLFVGTKEPFYRFSTETVSTERS